MKSLIKDSPEYQIELENLKKFIKDNQIMATIHFEDLSITAHNQVKLSHQNLKKIPYKFRKCLMSFDVSNNELESLENAPDEVVDNFNCGMNPNLNSLIGAPKKVGSFNCMGCNLTSLEGISKEITKETVVCSKNKIKSLDCLPKQLQNLSADNNCLTSLDYCPIILNSLDVSNNKIQSIESLPDKTINNLKILILMENEIEDLSKFKGIKDFTGTLFLAGNKLKNLQDCPQNLEYLNVSVNPLTSLRGCGVIKVLNCIQNLIEVVDFIPQELLAIYLVGNPLLDFGGLDPNVIAEYEKIESERLARAKRKIIVERLK